MQQHRTIWWFELIQKKLNKRRERPIFFRSHHPKYTFNDAVDWFGILTIPLFFDIHLSGADLSHSNTTLNRCSFAATYGAWNYGTIGLNYTKFAMLQLLLDFISYGWLTQTHIRHSQPNMVRFCVVRAMSNKQKIRREKQTKKIVCVWETTDLWPYVV